MWCQKEVSQSLLKTMSFCHEKAILSSNEMKGYNQRSCWGSSHHSPLLFPFCQRFNFCNREQSWLLSLQTLHCFTCAYMSTMVSIMLLLQWFPITVRKILKFPLELTGSDMSCSLTAPLLISYFLPHWVLAKILTYQEIMLWGHGACL